ncbi:Acg family FMN-binding oxidoreductase [Mucilaginibacter terrae]|uniref:Acg family FMN-binding oxidoreductase n=1 Tax=Mucilaginibacter terrae TaxID=1955052 RepID=UPI00362732E1
MMNRRRFLGIGGGCIVIAGVTSYALSDRRNLVRNDLRPDPIPRLLLKKDERTILYLASLAPSGHNTQPWFIKRLQPYHWIVCNDQTKWLTAVDPTQRETMLSIGAFLQNLEYAANNLGYACQFELKAKTNRDEEVMEVRLVNADLQAKYDTDHIKQRRTMRSGILPVELKQEDVNDLINKDIDFVHFIPPKTAAYRHLNEQTLEANKVQSYRDAAQKELANWIRFSSKDAEKYRDGLTPGSMEIEGFTGWVVRNFYGKPNVMKNGFRDQNIEQVEKQVATSGGWFVITSKNQSVTSLLETGQRMQRLFLKVRKKGIAIHPMTQILEEPSIHQGLNSAIGINEPVQFILRTGYLKNYPGAVSLRRPVDWLIRS